jgi:hypothetical protein
MTGWWTMVERSWLTVIWTAAPLVNGSFGGRFVMIGAFERSSVAVWRVRAGRTLVKGLQIIKYRLQFYIYKEDPNGEILPVYL